MRKKENKFFLIMVHQEYIYTLVRCKIARNMHCSEQKPILQQNVIQLLYAFIFLW